MWSRARLHSSVDLDELLLAVQESKVDLLTFGLLSRHLCHFSPDLDCVLMKYSSVASREAKGEAKSEGRG